MIDSNQYGAAAAGVAAPRLGTTFVVEDEAKADEALPVGPADVTTGANEEVDETRRTETCDAATGPIAPSRATAR